MIRRLIIKACCFLAVILLLNFIYTATLYSRDFKAYSPELLQLRKSISSTDVYYFGESSNTTFIAQDSLQSSISSLTSGFFPGLRFTNINKEATHAGTYRRWLGEFDRQSAYPRALIITLNLRSFDAAWIHSDLENSLNERLVMGFPYPPLVNRFLLSLQAFDVKSDAERQKDMLDAWKTEKLPLPDAFPYKTVRQWDDAMAAGGYVNADGSWNMKKIELACHYIKAFAFALDESNPRIQDLDKIKDWCQDRHVPLYLNLMAENVHFADSLVGKELVFLMRQNRDYLLKRYNSGNCILVDNLELVTPSDFIDQNWTTEHYKLKGRMRIAGHLAAELKKKFEKEYIKYY